MNKLPEKVFYPLMTPEQAVSGLFLYKIFEIFIEYLCTNITNLGSGDRIDQIFEFAFACVVFFSCETLLKIECFVKKL